MASNLIDATSSELKPEQPERGKNPAAVALGRLGGKKGGIDHIWTVGELLERISN
jgi:hypothetical protein